MPDVLTFPTARKRGYPQLRLSDADLPSNVTRHPAALSKRGPPPEPAPLLLATASPALALMLGTLAVLDRQARRVGQPSPMDDLWREIASLAGPWGGDHLERAQNTFTGLRLRLLDEARDQGAKP